MKQAKREEKISIGAALLQNPMAESGIETPERDINGYRVNGMPEGLEAHLLRTKASHRRWSFSVFEASGHEIANRQGQFDSKELALDGVKEWLRLREPASPSTAPRS
jgi:hypothetical protein